jgi:hypothetical protein
VFFLENVWWIFGGIAVVGVVVGVAESTLARHRLRVQFAANMRALQQRGFGIERTYPPEQRTPELYFDFAHKLGAYQEWVPRAKYRLKPIIIFPLDRIIECTLIQDGTVVHSNAVSGTVVSTSFMGLGVASVSGTVPSETSVVGALAVRILMDEITQSSLVIHVLSASLPKASDGYLAAFRRAQEIYGIFEGIVRINEAERSGVSSRGAKQAVTRHEATQTSDEHSQATVDLLRELGELRDSGVITATEFEAKKKALLDQIGQGPS